MGKIIELLTRPLGGQPPEQQQEQKEPGVVRATGMILRKKATISFLREAASAAQTLFGGAEEQQPQPRQRGPGRVRQTLGSVIQDLTQPLAPPGEESEPGLLSTAVQAARLGVKKGAAEIIAQAFYNAAFGARPEPEAPKEKKPSLLKTLIEASSLGAKQAMTEQAAQTGYKVTHSIVRIPGAALGVAISLGKAPFKLIKLTGWALRKGAEQVVTRAARQAQRQQAAMAE